MSKWTKPGAFVPIDAETTAALVGEIQAMEDEREELRDALTKANRTISNMRQCKEREARRDEFAKSAMQALVGQSFLYLMESDRKKMLGLVPQASYDIADMMLEARDK
jgi:predicted ATPase